jgi:hypothetical protein
LVQIKKPELPQEVLDAIADECEGKTGEELLTCSKDVADSMKPEEFEEDEDEWLTYLKQTCPRPSPEATQEEKDASKECVEEEVFSAAEDICDEEAEDGWSEEDFDECVHEVAEILFPPKPDGPPPAPPAPTSLAQSRLRHLHREEPQGESQDKPELDAWQKKFVEEDLAAFAHDVLVLDFLMGMSDDEESKKARQEFRNSIVEMTHAFNIEKMTEGGDGSQQPPASLVQRWIAGR